MQKLFGTHPVIEALKTGKQIDKVLIKQGMEGPVYRELITLNLDQCQISIGIGTYQSSGKYPVVIKCYLNLIGILYNVIVGDDITVLGQDYS